ncbi:hypothetical protein C8F01DRAFT_1147234 [Mycena amicta]|nr:hypothetical protein C8F01DRAFT_1147234 [Mycena amicta]
MAEWQSPESAPWVLTHVCRDWRGLALALPRIWSQIYLGNQSSLQIDTMLRLWFARAGSSPLQVKAPTQGNPRLYSLMTTYSDHFKSFSCRIPVPSTCSLEGMSGRLPKLRNLGLTVTHAHDQITVFSDAPELRELDICYWDPGAIGQIDLPWTQLTEVRFVGVAVPTILQTVEKMPQLQILQLPAAKYLLPAATIPLIHLHTLRCTSQTGPAAPDTGNPSLRCLSSLQCPALEVLDIEVPVGRHSNILCSFLDGTTRLRSLSLCQLSDAQARYILPHAATIKNLAIAELATRSLFFDIISHSLDLPLLLPKLTELTVTTPGVEFLYSSILSMLKRRGKAGQTAGAQSTALQRLTFTSREEEIWFDPEEGLEIPKITSEEAFAQELREVGRSFGCRTEVNILHLFGDSDGGSPYPGHVPLYSLVDV